MSYPAGVTHGVTRLAPSPTGALHLGNARTFLATWAMARSKGWRIVLRVEDLDTPRVKPGVLDLTIDLLAWLGIDWDQGPFIQSADRDTHEEAMRRLVACGRAYPCAMSRAEIEAAASAPQEGSGEIRFPASLRPARRPRDFDDGSPSWRFVVDDDAVVRFDDEFAGPQAIRPAESIGDFVVWTRRDPAKPGQAAYQLAVVVDDARQGVTHVVRGDDLIDSAARQLLIMRALGLAREPAYCHLPLVRGEDGRRLAKRHGDTRLDAYRAAGVTAERVIGLVGAWCGIVPSPRPMDAREFLSGFELNRIPGQPIIFTASDDRWLRARSGA
ncbi:MAG: glutamate--tRNA ligase family protein [Phycisphaerae bacterium]